MKRRGWLSRGQSTAEYATMVLIIVVLVSVMHTFLKRAQQASIRKVTLDMINAGTENGVFDGTVQFEPSDSYSEMYLKKDSTGFVKVYGKGITHTYSNSTSELRTEKTSYEEVKSYEETQNVENWGWNVTINEIKGYGP